MKTTENLTSAELRKLQQVELELLSEVDRICRKHSIKYSLYAGTLLGAVRHKGFIPWDDDADICFFPEEYDKFFEACKTDLNTEKFFLQDYRTDPCYRWGYPKLRRNDSSFVRKGQEHIRCHTGICIDLFVLYNVPNNAIYRKLYYLFFAIIRKILYSEVGRLSATSLPRRILYKLLSLIPHNFVLTFAHKMIWPRPSQMRNHLFCYARGVLSDYFVDNIDLEYEGKLFSCIKEYDKCLTHWYRDYMKQPPESCRTSHNPASKIVFPKKFRQDSKRILILGANIFQIPVIEKAKEMGLYVGIVDISPEAPAISAADEFFTCSIRDKNGILEIAKAFGADAILPGACDTGVIAAAYVCAQLGLAGLREEVAYKATNKLQMIQAFKDYGVAHPAFQFVKNDIDINLDPSLKFPLIIKPVDSAGSRGIYLAHTQKDLYEKVKKSLTFSTSGGVVIEEYLTGPEVSVEVLVVDGVPYVLQITDKTTTGAPSFIETGHLQPSCHFDDVKQQIISLASKAVLAVGINNSPAHVEMKITNDGPKMIELGARMGGDFITSYLLDTSVSGIDMKECAILLTLGELPDIPKYHNSGICVAMRTVPAQQGVVRRIEGVDKARTMRGVLRVIVCAKEDERFLDASSNEDRIAIIIATGRTPIAAQRACENAVNSIVVHYCK